MNTYTVTALKTASLTVPKAAMTYMSGFGETINLPVWVAAIEGNGMKMLLDTGIRYHDKWNAKIHPVWNEPDETLAQLASSELEKMGLVKNIVYIG